MTEKIFYWLPRMITILAILFMGMFSMDVFSMDASLGKKILGFIIHNIPALILAVILVIAWKWEIPGGILMFFAGLLACFYFNSFTTNRGSLVIFIPFMLTGLLFILHSFMFKTEQK